MTIRILDDRVANQIAAGEVIERPAAAVKELVENALDAGATRVDVEFRAGGLELIRVEDNGRGMSREDAVMSLERHATSKLTDASDLDRLASFGFRGEALPSIASVSKFTLLTKTAESAAGTEVTVSAGAVGPVRDCGRAVGTSIIVEHLFHPVPARRKFLKTEGTESAHIVQVVRLYALAFPAVSFSLRQDGRMVFQSPRGQSLTERVGGIFGKEIAEGLLSLEVTEGAWSVRGLIGRPGQGQAGRHAMISYVNHRPVDSKTINFALFEGYRESLPKGRYPAAFLFITCDPAQVDVNVHPAKREVRFRKDNEIRSFLIRAVLQRLREFTPAGGEEGSGSEFRVAEAPPALGVTGPSGQPSSPPDRWVQGIKKEEISSAPLATGPGATAEGTGQHGPERAQPSSLQTKAAAGAAGRAPGVGGWRFVGLTRNPYALFETPSGLVVLDRRAAAERVFFEKTLQQFHQEQIQIGTQHLLLPIPLELDPISSAMVLDAKAFLNAHGFALAEFGRNFFRLEGVPTWIDSALAEPFLREIIAALREGRLVTTDLEQARAQLITLALGRAGNLPLATAESDLRRLLADLLSTRLPLTSPAGRPTFIELGWNELDRRFHRA